VKAFRAHPRRQIILGRIRITVDGHNVSSLGNRAVYFVECSTGVRPCEWTVSSGSFGCLLGVLILELPWADYWLRVFGLIGLACKILVLQLLGAIA
jgi:hypothetical protein